ncbi:MULTISPECIES: DNA translocase FtsK [Clostridium]|uniref:DNA translocase FtsK 4TM domain-containing protein n=1 Tax=Clostridium aquiflavi TaxID=3073603 RepID=A0ABU1EES4_9CLOT|nr:DNA translocase FtsK [Clostridium sp. 5N-1]MDR5586875.1 DNA translocase FtsK 4TM domain-containing protein [Clostridium sp. 5N-1]NFG61558.1 DNA translocase FtsK [Clostridium botulinum]NFQ10647.1 DNA translocase FtsK [Clostridium botulinum]
MSRSGTKRSNKKTKKESNINNDILGIIYMAIGVILAIAIYTSLAGLLSSLAQNFSYLLIGVGSYAIPIYLIYFGFQYIKTRGNVKFGKRFLGILMLILILILTCSVINIQMMNDTDSFGDNIRFIIDNKGSLHGGLIAYFICYPLYRFMGAIGTYILFFTLSVISLILIFDINLYDLVIVAKDKGKKIKSERNVKSKSKKDVKVLDNTFVNVVEKDEDVPIISKEKDAFLSTVDKKIKILDFMKNDNIKDDVEGEFSSDIENQITENIVEEKKATHKKIKLNSEEKQNMSSEIEENLYHEQNKEDMPYFYPGLELLKINKKLKGSDKKELIENASKLEEILSNFGVDAKVTQVTKGPSVTRFELQPSPGVKVSKIVNLSDDIALGLAASGIRIEAPIPGKAAIGIEVPNSHQVAVFLREVLESKEFINSSKKLAFALGKDISGKCVVGDLSKMPHTLIAGATGSGKSVCINSLIISLLYKYSPNEVKLLMVDPKVVELNVYNGIPHLLIPVVTDPKKAAAALNWAVNEMTKRYKLFAEMGVRNMESYNELFNKGVIEEKLPYIVIIVDELADLMMVCPNDVEDYIGRLAQMARAAGMHLVIATQRPSVDVITGVIKANIPSRISFAVSSQIDSRTILDSSGAEKLLGKGDMLYYPVGESKPLRVQGCFISEEEVEQVISFVKSSQGTSNYEEEIIEHINNEAQSSISENGDDVDELLNDAINAVIEYEQASTSFLQRKLRIGFNRASRIMDQLEERGIISEKDGSRPRKILITKEELYDDKDEN